MTKFALWIAALGVSALGSSAVNALNMTLTSSDIKEGATIVNEQVFKGFGCTGSNISPTLSWSGAPSGTKSFAVTIYDPDAPTGSGWWGAIQSRTDFGADGYGGPCPPTGDKPHHYQITVFAVDVDKLPDAKNDAASAALVGVRPAFPYLG